MSIKAFKLCFLISTLISLSTTAHAAKAPSFTLDGDKGKISLSSFKNKVVYVDFWASWCKPCRKSFPFMNEMQERYGKKGLQIIGINLDSERSAAQAFLKKNPASFKVAYDPDGKTPGLYKLKVMPTSYLIDKRGNVTNIHKGFKPNQKQELEALINKTLSQR